MRGTASGPGQVQGEPAALAGAPVHRHPAAMGLHDVPDQRQPHPAPPAALRLAPSDAIELLEDSLALGNRDPDPLVGHLDRTPSPSRRADTAIFRRSAEYFMAL